MRVLRFYKPAAKWTEALPIGNGKTALMVYGGTKREILDLNDAELWSGFPKDDDNPLSATALTEVRRLVFEGKYAEADAVVMSRMDGGYSEAFMPLGRVKIAFSGAAKGGYERRLSMDDATVSIDCGAIARRAFCSFPDNVAVYTAESKNKFAVKLTLSSKLKSASGVLSGLLTLWGNAPDRALPNYLRNKPIPISYKLRKGMAFCLAVRAESDGKVSFCGKALKIKNATYVRFYMTTDTGFRSYSEAPDTDAVALRNKCAAALAGRTTDFDKIYSAHIKDFGEIFGRQKLIIKEGSGDAAALLAEAKRGSVTAEIINLLYDYGKYLTVSGSRASQPLNLQGQWNKSVRPPWSSNLTTNINTEMNYWGASRCGLFECIEPFYKAVSEIAERGKKTALTNFGAVGFCANHNSDIWRKTSPVRGNPCYMYAPLCGAWLAHEVFRHKKNAGHIDAFVIRLIEEVAAFCIDYLTEKDGFLTVCPSTSPEASFLTPDGISAVGYGSAFDMSVIRQIFKDCLECTPHEELIARIENAQARLAPFERAANGLAEWQGGFASSEAGHRHFSPLFGIYPGNVITSGDKEYAWAYVLFKHRTANITAGIGWSAAWAICLAARFGDRERAKHALESFVQKSVLPNLFGFHPPAYFQIDANLGFVAAINELLIGTEEGKIRFLPACLDVIKDGEITGLRLDGATISFEWKDGMVVKASSDKPVEALPEHIAANAELINIQKVQYA